MKLPTSAALVIVLGTIYFASSFIRPSTFSLRRPFLMASSATNNQGGRIVAASPTKKGRIDDILLARSMVATKEEVKALVMTGNVLLANGEVVTSAATKVNWDSEIRLRQRKNEPYVSRGGRKLAHALNSFNLSETVANAVCIDIGCSTGGFTDVLLQNNCSVVYAVDVGQSLLDWKIRSNPKVIVLEKQNARYINSSTIHSHHVGGIGVVVCDVSFISLRLVLPPSLSLCQPGAILCALIKPQFECERNELGEGGVVRDQSVRDRVVASILSWFDESFSPDWVVEGVVTSPITGQDGNVEYVMVARKVGLEIATQEVAEEVEEEEEAVKS